MTTLCPVCRTATMAMVTLDGLGARQCTECEGVWVTAAGHALADEHLWPAATPQQRADASDRPSWEAGQEFDPAKLCPYDGRILLKYRLGADVGFRLDRCSACHGIWFDPGEWDELTRLGMRRELALVFTDEWQDAVRAEEQQRLADQLREGRFGAHDLARMREFKAWVDDHEQRSAVLAYLNQPATG